MAATKLSDFIRSNIEPILQTWEQFAKEIPIAKNFEIAALRDHASGILQAIATDLDHAQSAPDRDAKSKGRAPRGINQTDAEMHGAGRMLEGFSAPDTMSEFRALRASVLRLWSESSKEARQPFAEELMRFNEAVDQALSESIVRYDTDKVKTTRLLDALLSSTPDLNYILDADGKFIYANRSVTLLYGVAASEIIGKDIFSSGMSEEGDLRQVLRQVIVTKTPCRREMPHSYPYGKMSVYEHLFVPVVDSDGRIEAIAGTARDITERKATEEEITRSANYDALTDLPNRSLFRDRLEQEVKRSQRNGVPIALLFIDLDGFKEVNDRLGHDAGDRLLQEAARRINSCVRLTDTVARLGGDEFTVILTAVNRIAHVEIVAAAILDELAKPFAMPDKDVLITCSIGITLFPQDAATPEDLVRNADQAMYVAKNAGRNRFSFFTIGMRESTWARLKVIDELRRALPLHQLDIFYQPIVNLSDEGIVKAEALLRWHHPEIGLMLPDDFIGLAEETGLISEIGEWVLEEAMRRAQEWSTLLGVPFQISVNKSPVEFMSKGPMESWNGHLTALGLAWNSISVEITEGVLLSDSPNVRNKLDSLQKAGVQLAIDDFGTGYSSMAYLKKFEVDYLKIDQSFVRDMTSSPNSRTIAEAIIVMAHKLGLKVIAEGVETVEQRDWLKSADCDYAQGFLFSKPVAPHEFALLLKPARGCAPRPT